jgi:hypothetical protein
MLYREMSAIMVGCEGSSMERGEGVTYTIVVVKSVEYPKILGK